MYLKKKIIDLLINQNIIIKTNDGLDVVKYDTTKFKDEDEFLKYKLKFFNGEEKINIIKFMKKNNINYKEWF